MTEILPKKFSGQIIELRTLLDDLLADGCLSQQDHDRIVSVSRTPEQATLHPTDRKSVV